MTSALASALLDQGPEPSEGNKVVGVSVTLEV
jgi:hypothetical protein